MDSNQSNSYLNESYEQTYQREAAAAGGAPHSAADASYDHDEALAHSLAALEREEGTEISIEEFKDRQKQILRDLKVQLGEEQEGEPCRIAPAVSQEKTVDVLGRFQKQHKVKPRPNPSKDIWPPHETDGHELDDDDTLTFRLSNFALQEYKVQGDGNCQFRALAHQMYGDQEQHERVRAKVVHELLSNRERYESYAPSFGDYIQKMVKPPEWGDHLTLQAAANALQVEIYVITNYKDESVISVLPDEDVQEQQQQQQQWAQAHRQALWLTFRVEVHYNSVQPKTDAPEAEPTHNATGKRKPSTRPDDEHRPKQKHKWD